MRNDRDDFPLPVKDVLAKRVGCRCCNPGCRKLTSGPHEEPTKAVNIGVAAHITAAAPGGKRYDPNLSSEERKAIENGIWLCQNCGKLIDSDEQKYSVELLRNWKGNAEQQASVEVETRTPQSSSYSSSKFEQYLENLVDTPQIWWLDEINESTWYEFELFTKVQEKPEQLGDQPKDNLKPVLKAICDTKKQSILIAGAPGAGKSTLLEKLAKEAARIAQSDWDEPIPVLVRLKDYEASGERSGIRGLIQSALESDDPSLDAEAMNQLLQNQKILLLIDGWNELSDENAKSKIKKFCQPHSVLVTSRNVGDYWEIQEKFEIQPLSRNAVERFFAQRLPNTQRTKLQELVDRVSDFGQTPIMVWMLFSIFCDDGSIPKTRGETYRAFTKAYAKKAKAEIDLDNARKLLGKLAFEMMKSPTPKTPTDFRLKVTEVEAEEIFGSEAELDRMLNHLLKQQGKLGIREISFCHQSLQEYYAAEHLWQELVQHPEWLQKQTENQHSWFQHHYLNYTKWTESVAIMLGLPEINQDLAEQVVKSGLNVDLMLGTRLAGEVKPKFQEQTVGLLDRLIEQKNLPEWLRVELWGKTRSEHIIQKLEYYLQHNHFEVRARVYAAFRGIGSILHQSYYDFFRQMSLKEEGINRYFAISSLNNDVKDLQNIMHLLKEPDLTSEIKPIYNLLSQKAATSKDFLDACQKGIQQLDNLGLCQMCIALLIFHGGHRVIPILIEGFKNQKSVSMKIKIAEAIQELGYPEFLPNLWQVVLEDNSDVTWTIEQIQSNCKFYNYEIWQEAEAIQNEKLEMQDEGRGTVTHPPTNVFNIETLHAPGAATNLGGTIQGDQIGAQPHLPEP